MSSMLDLQPGTVKVLSPADNSNNRIAKGASQPAYPIQQCTVHHSLIDNEVGVHISKITKGHRRPPLLKGNRTERGGGSFKEISVRN